MRARCVLSIKEIREKFERQCFCTDADGISPFFRKVFVEWRDVFKDLISAIDDG